MTATTLGAESPSAAQAISAARLYAVRRGSSSAHNLVRGLAWLSEALAAPSLSEVDRRQLQREAAWIWLDLSVGEVPLALRAIRPMNQFLFERAIAASASLPPDADRSVLELALARCRTGDRVDAPRLRTAWQQVRGVAAESLEGIRLRARLVTLQLTDTDVPRQLATDLMNELANTSSPGDDVALRWRARYVVVLGHLLLRPGLEGLPLPLLPPAHYLPHALFHERCVLHGHVVAAHDDVPDGVMRDVVSNDLTMLEGDFWGWRRDDGVPAWLSTGSPGAGWARVTGAVLAPNFALPQAQVDFARHFTASVHLGADLRVAPLAAHAVLTGFMKPEERPIDLWVLARGRERHIDVLLDGAAIGQLATASDLFTRSLEQVVEALPRGPEHLTAWLAAETLESWAWEQPGRAVSRVAAFDLERRVLELDAAIARAARSSAGHVQKLRNDVEEPRLKPLIEFTLGPPRDLEVLERGLAALPENVAVLAALEGAQGELLLAATWTENGQPRQEIHVARDAAGARLGLLLSELQRVREEDHGVGRGRARGRSKVWDDLRALLDTPLALVLRGIGNRRLRVLATHGLRGLPWLGLTASGAPLRTRLHGVAQLPFLGFENLSALRLRTSSPNTFCVLGGTPETGETQFGAAAIGTLRRFAPNTLRGEPAAPVGTTITEVDLIEARDREIQVLRFYGTGSPWAFNGSTEGLVLKHGRTLSLRNIDWLRLAACECVELWAAVEGGGAASRQTAGIDSMPALVRGFIVAGAGGVVDVAWPIHDLVKALVCERFGVLRRVPMQSPDALALAVTDIGKLLDEWQAGATSFATVEEALTWLDERRRQNVRRAGGAADVVVPFRPLAEAEKSSSATAFIQECCAPVHLAAFRWWGA